MTPNSGRTPNLVWGRTPNSVWGICSPWPESLPRRSIWMCFAGRQGRPPKRYKMGNCSPRPKSAPRGSIWRVLPGLQNSLQNLNSYAPFLSGAPGSMAGWPAGWLAVGLPSRRDGVSVGRVRSQHRASLESGVSVGRVRSQRRATLESASGQFGVQSQRRAT